MRTHLTLAIVAILAIPSLGLAQKVRTDYDHGANFANYKTYSFVKIVENPAISQLNHQRILAAVEENLAARGLQQVDSGGDLMIGYQASVEKQEQYTTFNNGIGPGWGWGPGWGGGSSISTTTSQIIPIGTLSVDMMDPAQKQLIWRGTVSDTLSDKPEKNADKIKKAVKKLFEKYPPKEKK